MTPEQEQAERLDNLVNDLFDELPCDLGELTEKEFQAFNGVLERALRAEFEAGRKENGK